MSSLHVQDTEFELMISGYTDSILKGCANIKSANVFLKKKKKGIGDLPAFYLSTSCVQCPLLLKEDIRSLRAGVI